MQVLLLLTSLLIRMLMFKQNICSSEQDNGNINIYDSKGSNEPIRTITLHSKPVTFIGVSRRSGSLIDL